MEYEKKEKTEVLLSVINEKLENLPIKTDLLSAVDEIQILMMVLEDVLMK